jgi:tetratricopeptide (TPR) repeat protein
MAGKLLKLRNLCMIVCAVLVFVYLTLLCSANPSAELLFALAVEVLSFAGFLYFRHRRARSAGGRAGEAVISELKNQYAALRLWSKLLSAALTSFWLVAAIAMSIDCFAFAAAFFGAQKISLYVYRAVPISAAIGFHPGASLEVLAGALVEAHKYEQAMPFYEEILALRLSTFGKVHREIAAIFCDFGDLYSHQGQLLKAESCYRMALKITATIRKDKGRALTRLANCLRDQGRFGEADEQYKNAYDMRVRQFGVGSEKVAETLKDWAKLQALEGKKEEAAALQARVDKIAHSHREMPPLWSALCSLSLFAASLFVSNLFFGRRGVLTELAVGKIKAAVDASECLPGGIGGKQPTSKSVTRGQLNRLITLYRFQKKYEEADRYNAILLSLGKD